MYLLFLQIFSQKENKGIKLPKTKELNAHHYTHYITRTLPIKNRESSL